jgi:hypothetical protein
MPGRMSLLTAIISIVLLFHVQLAGADDLRGRILKANGDVYVINPQGVKRKINTSTEVVRELDTIVTQEGGKAVVQFNDGALSVLDQKSSLRVEKTNWLSHIGGKIYFTFRKVFGEPRQVRSAFATIGVRGTTFIVYEDESGEGVALQEGRLEIESPGPDFELHIRRELDEFEAFKQQALEQREAMRSEFDQYKQQLNREFVEYRKNFTLEANRVIRFDGKRVDETSMDDVDNDRIKAEFSNFEQEAGEMLQQFREQSKQYRDQHEQKEKDF